MYAPVKAVNAAGRVGQAISKAGRVVTQGEASAAAVGKVTGGVAKELAGKSTSHVSEAVTSVLEHPQSALAQAERGVVPPLNGQQQPPIRVSHDTKLLWSSWRDYPKVTLDGKEYAKIGDRLYTQHAVDRMLPSGLGAPAGATGAGRSCAPNFVEQAIREGTKRTEIKNGIERTYHTIGSAEVITEKNGEIVITVNPFKN